MIPDFPAEVAAIVLILASLVPLANSYDENIVAVDNKRIKISECLTNIRKN